MKRVLRIDRGTLRKPERTSQGFLRVEGLAARPGIYEYVNTREDEAEGYGKAGTIRRELRPDEEVRSPRALASYEAAPVTIGHPRKANGDPDEVTPANVRALEVGTVIGARLDDDDVATALVVKDARGISAVEGGKHELSPGYRISLEKRSGTDPKYGRFDVIQREIEVNHLALVDRARGGSAMRLRMDEAIRRDGDAKLTTAIDGHQHLIEMTGYDGVTRASGCTSWAVSEGKDAGHDHGWVRNADGTITIATAEGHGHEILDENRVMSGLNAVVDAALNQRTDAQIDRSGMGGESGPMADKTDKQRADELEGEKKILVARVTELEGMIAAGATAAETEAVKAEKVRADAADDKVRELERSFEERVTARAQLLHEARIELGHTFRVDGLNERQLREQVVKRLDSSIDVKQSNNDVLRGQYQALIARSAANKDSQRRVGEIIGRRADEIRIDERAERDKRMDAYRNQWRNTGRTAAANEGR